MDDKDLLVVFGLNLKYERLKHKYSQEKVAGELNFSTSYVSNVESGFCLRSICCRTHAQRTNIKSEFRTGIGAN